MHHQGRGLIVDISDFLNPEPCRAWSDLRWAYRTIYRPLSAPLRLRVPGAVLNGVRRGYRLIRRLRRIAGGAPLSASGLEEPANLVEPVAGKVAGAQLKARH
jgi:hypothetical protein